MFEKILTFLIFPSCTAAVWLFFVIWVWCWLPPIVIRSGRLHLNATGMAFLNFIFIHTGCGSSDSARYQYVYRHEVEHVRQMRWYSPWGCAIFLGGWYFWRCIIKRQKFINAWRDNPLEVMANRSAQAVLRETQGR